MNAADREFLTAMIAHHEEAVRMAGEILEDGEDARVLALAERIIAAQQAEIASMRAWLEGENPMHGMYAEAEEMGSSHCGDCACDCGCADGSMVCACCGHCACCCGCCEHHGSVACSCCGHCPCCCVTCSCANAKT